MKISKLFNISYGQRKYHSKEELSNGATLLISSKGEDNGGYGFFDIDSKYNSSFITVPSTGTIGQAFVQTNPCCVDDNCLTLIPKENYSNEYLFYVSLMIRMHKWRFMYGRQLTPERIGRIEILSPKELKLKVNYSQLFSQVVPIKQNVTKINYSCQKKEFLISDLFIVDSGEYHSINKLKEGLVPLVSCTTMDNGISGFYNIPEKNTHRNAITVAYDGKPLTTRFHDYQFSAYDNVGILTPKWEMKRTTLLFITILLNIEGWRYSYGRKCYKQKLEKLNIKLPVTEENKVDEEYIEKIMLKRDLFGYFK